MPYFETATISRAPIVNVLTMVAIRILAILGAMRMVTVVPVSKILGTTVMVANAPFPRMKMKVGCVVA